MAEDGDVDALLSEIDGLLTDDAAPAPPGRPIMAKTFDVDGRSSHRPPMQRANTFTTDQSMGGAIDDIDSLLADVCSAAPQTTAPFTTRSSAAAAYGRGTVPVVVPNFPRSVSSPDSDPSETNLRCARCDFKVLRFMDQRWDDSADYMFFRNFMPDRQKLQQKLTASEGEVAFACQCSWASVSVTRRQPQYDYWFPVTR